MKKHQINVLTAQPYEDGAQPIVTKKFVSGRPVKLPHPKYWTQEIIGWNTLRELSEILTPYINGTAPGSEYKAICYGAIKENFAPSYGVHFVKRKAFMEDTEHKYFILDIETDAPDYEDICLDLAKVRAWLIDTYSWIQKDTGMFLYFSASAGVVTLDGKEKNKQIRVRAIMEHTSILGLGEDERKNVLRPYMKHHGEGKDFYRHIDNGTHQLWRHFYLAPPVLHGTERILTSLEPQLLVEGNPIEFDSIRTLEVVLAKKKSADNNSSSKLERKSADFTSNITTTRYDIKTKTTDEWYKEIGDGNRYEGHYFMLWSAYVEKNLKYWRNKLLNDPIALGDKTPESIDTVIEYIEDNHSIDFAIPFDIENHNITDIPDYLLDDWEGTITWNDKGVILQKLYEGAGKTEGLKKLRKLFPDKSFLYMAPNIKPVDNACIDLGLSNYQGLGESIADTKKDGKPVVPHLGLCYPSLKFLAKNGKMKRISWDIIVLDEIEQLLCFATENGIIQNPAENNGIIRHLVERADIVVGLDARLSNLSLQCLEHWRKDESFDIYTQSKVLPFIDHHFTFVGNLQAGVSEVINAINDGKRVAVVSELDNNKTKQYTLEALKDYVESQTDIKGLTIASQDKATPLQHQILTELSRDGNIGKLEQLLKDNAYKHFWFSPVVQSSWSYLSEEQPFDLVVGLYPNRVLTAPNIVQHIKRFRTSKEFVMYIEQRDFKTNPKKIYNKLFPPKDADFDIDLGLGEFNARHALKEQFEEIQLNNREEHFKEEISNRGADWEDKTAPAENKGVTKFISEKHEELKELLQSSRTWKLHEELEGVHDLP